MKVAYCSDLHLEFDDVTITNTLAADVLVLAGDVCVARKALQDKSTSRFFQSLLKEFNHVVYIMGNHEHYGSKFQHTADALRSVLPSKVTFLDNTSRVIDGVMFVGGTLWTNMNDEDPITLMRTRYGLNDFRTITWQDGEGTMHRKFTPEDVVRVHHKTLWDFDAELQNRPLDVPVVMVSHHAPSELSVHDDYRGDYYMNGAYRSLLEDYILDRPEIKLWIHGHMHNEFDYSIGDTRVLCNPRGYQKYGENPNFSLKAVDVPT